MEAIKSIAFAGNADLDKNELADLLEDVLPDPVVVYLPTFNGDSPGLSKLKKWMDSVEQPYEVVNDLLAQNPDVVALFWDDTDETYALLEEATKEDIPVKDMTAAFDDLILDDDGADTDFDEEIEEEQLVLDPEEAENDIPVEEPESNAKAEVKPRRTRAQEDKFQEEKARVSVAESEISVPTFNSDDVPTTEELGKRLDALAEDNNNACIEVADDLAVTELVKAITRFVDSRVAKAFESAKTHYADTPKFNMPLVTNDEPVPHGVAHTSNKLEFAAGEVVKDSERKSSDKIDKLLDGAKPYVKDADGTHRKRGRGKLRKGSEIVYLTDVEARKFGLEV